MTKLKTKRKERSCAPCCLILNLKKRKDDDHHHKKSQIFLSVRPLQFMILLLLFLTTIHPSTAFDLLSTLMSQGSSAAPSPNLKSLVSPEMLSRVKGLLPSLPNMNSQTDLSQIEKLIAKLKPVEGRFDPAMLELLANMDARMPPGLTSQKLDHHLHQNSHNRKKYDEDHHHHSQNPHKNQKYPPISSTTLASNNGFTITTTPGDGKPKFSSKFRLEEGEEEEGENSENYSENHHPPSLLPPMASIIPQTTKNLDHITDPNIRNHRLYELEQERFENYENFTALDQIEDLLAEESHPHQVFVPFENSPASKHRRRYKSTTTTSTPSPMKTSTSGTSGWIGKPFTPRRPHLDNLTPTTSSSSSYEEAEAENGGSLMSIESTSAPLDDDSGGSSGGSSSSAQMMHDREPLKLASTEKTIIYRHNVHKTRNKNKAHHHRHNHYDKSSSSSSSTNRPSSTTTTTTGRFKPSPIDLSPPVHFEPDQDFYTATINKGGSHSHKKGSRRRQQHHLRDENDNDQLSKDHHGQIYSEDQGYEKEQPDFQHAVSYLQSNLNKNSVPHLDVYPMVSNGPQNNNNNNNDHGTLVSKQDRILHNVHGLPGHQNQNQMTPLPPYMIDPTMSAPGMMMMDSSRLKNQYFAGSEQINYPVYPPQSTPQSSYAGGNYQMAPSSSSGGAGHINNDVAYSAAAGQNYYQGTSAGHHYPSYHHHQQPVAAASGHHGHGSSSWTSTFFLLAGLIALSAIVAFFLPSFLAGAGTTTGKDTGDIDKIAEIESSPDLWTEIKGLYGDIVNIVKGDYSAFHRQGVRPTDLPNIQIVDGDDNEQADGGGGDGQSKVVINKRQGVVAGQSDDEDEDDDDDKNRQEEEEDEDEDDDDSLRGMKKKKKVLRKNVNISDTLAFGVYAPGGKVVGNRLFNSSRNVNFLNDFNQTLQAWEKVPLIVHR